MTPEMTMQRTYTVAECVGMTVNQYMFDQRKTKTELSRLLGVSQPSASRRITGQIGWDVEDLMRVSWWLGLEMTDLTPSVGPEGSWVPAPFIPGKAKGPVTNDRALAGTPSGTRTLDPQIQGHS